MIGGGFSQKVIEEVNKIRLSPKTYSLKIRGYLSCFDGNILRIPRQPGLMTQEGPAAYQEAADFLLTVPKLNKLTFEKGLNLAAQDMATELCRYQDLGQMDGVKREEIINRYGHYEGQFGESEDFGSLTPEMVVINLLVDDGDKNRNNRKLLFKEGFRKIGVGATNHPTFKSVTVLMYATEYISSSSLTQEYSRPAETFKSTGNNNYKTTKISAVEAIQGAKGGYRQNNPYGKQMATTSVYTRVEGTNNHRPGERGYEAGIEYRYVNDVDPNKDLICDSAKFDNIKQTTVNTENTIKANPTVFKEETFQEGTQAGNPVVTENININQQGEVPRKETVQPQTQPKPQAKKGKEPAKVGGGGSILNTNVESSGWTPSLQNTDYVKARQRAEEMDRANAEAFRAQYAQKIPQNVKTAGGGILNTNVESSGWAPSLQRNYQPPPQEQENEYMKRVEKNAATQKVGGGGILNTNVESSGWVTDFEKQKSPEYWRAKQEYQDNYRGMEPLMPANIQAGGGGGAIGNSNVESGNWNDYSGYERRIPYYHQEKQYAMYPEGTNEPVQLRGDEKGVVKVETSERMIREGGRNIKETRVIKHMENGEVRTEIKKEEV